MKSETSRTEKTRQGEVEHSSASYRADTSLLHSPLQRRASLLADRLGNDPAAISIHDHALWEGDVETFLKSLPQQPLFDLVVTSPPYNIGNPAAASEGVSLHRICHHAIYLDRTFNAAHYLQSEDRIHRFGLNDHQKTDIEIVECVGTIDETVRNRLGYKIGRMAEALEDSSLRPDPIPLDPNDIDDIEEYSTGLSQSTMVMVSGRAQKFHLKFSKIILRT